VKQIAIFLAAVFAASAWSQVYVNPYVRKDGTYVQGHVRSSPNSTDLDNYSTQGNINPYTGQAGTQRPSYQQPSYSSPPQPTYGQQCGYTASGRYVCR